MPIRAMLPYLVAVALGCLLPSCSRYSKVVREADELQQKAFLEYTGGSFESATNALLLYVTYLDANEPLIAAYKDYDAIDLNGQDVPFPVRRYIPVTQFTPHSMLACMMMYSGNTHAAIYHLSRAYPYHVEIWERAQKPPMTKEDFVQFLLDVRDKIDAKTGAKWKMRFTLDTNTVAEISASWFQQAQQTR
jgi:hypothetical protein